MRDETVVRLWAAVCACQIIFKEQQLQMIYFIRNLSSSITAISKDGLPSDPATLSHKEPNQRGNVLDVRQTTFKRLALVELDSLW